MNPAIGACNTGGETSSGPIRSGFMERLRLRQPRQAPSRGMSLGLTQIRKWKRKDDHVALHESLHASSSSTRSQSFASTSWLANAVGTSRWPTFQLKPSHILGQVFYAFFRQRSSTTCSSDSFAVMAVVLLLLGWLAPISVYAPSKMASSGGKGPLTAVTDSFQSPTQSE